MAILRFATNVPQEVRLQSLTPREVDSNYGGKQHLFAAAEGIFYVSDKVGAILCEQFAVLGVKPGQPIEITKAETGAGPGRSTRWIVSTGSDAAEPASDLERQLADSIAIGNARKAAQRAPLAVPAPAPAVAAQANQQPAWARALATQTRALIDVYAEAVAYASQQHGNSVKPEDVRSMMTTLFINMSKNGGASHAA